MDNNFKQPKLTIQAYDLITMLQEVEAAVKQGLTFDFESNANYPQLLGTIYVIPMVKGPNFDDSEVTLVDLLSSTESLKSVEAPQGTVTEKEPEVNEAPAEVKEPAKRGPKAKAKTE